MRASCTGSIAQSAAPRNQTNRDIQKDVSLVATSRGLKNKRPPLAVFYSILFCQYHRFCYSSPHTARKGACEGGDLCRVFPQDAAHRAQWRVTSVLPQAKSWHRRNSLPPSTFNPLGVERRAAAEPKNKRPPLAVFYFWCERWDLNPHDLTDTSTSSLPVCRFQHARGQDT